MKKITGILQTVILILGIILLVGLIALIYNGLRTTVGSSNSAIYYGFRTTSESSNTAVSIEGNNSVYIQQRNAKLRSEIQHAVGQTNTLSRLGATTTSNVLGKIREYVHGIEVVNDLNVGLFDEVGRLYQQSVFDDIYDIIDTYDAKLSSGQKVSDSITDLTAAIDDLETQTITIINASET